MGPGWKVRFLDSHHEQPELWCRQRRLRKCRPMRGRLVPSPLTRDFRTTGSSRQWQRLYWGGGEVIFCKDAMYGRSAMMKFPDPVDELSYTQWSSTCWSLAHWSCQVNQLNNWSMYRWVAALQRFRPFLSSHSSVSLASRVMTAGVTGPRLEDIPYYCEFLGVLLWWCWRCWTYWVMG